MSATVVTVGLLLVFEAATTVTSVGALTALGRGTHDFFATAASLPTAPRATRVLNISGQLHVCNADAGSRFLDRTLLVVQFTVRLGPVREREVMDMYSCFFPHTVRYVFCGKNVEAERAAGFTCLPQDTLATDDDKHGLPWYFPASTSYLQYEFFAHALTTWPDYSGYIFAQDDCIVNFWNFRSKDADKVWRALSFPDPVPLVWNMHKNLSLESADRHGTIAATWTRPTLHRVREFVGTFTPAERQRLYAANSQQGLPSFRMASSDFYYVPARFRLAVANAFTRARKLMVMHEIAVPITFDALLEPHEYEVASGAALSSVTDSIKKMALYNPCWDFFHKLKPSIAREWAFTLEAVMRYGAMADTWDCHGSGRDGLTSYALVQ